MLERLEQLEKAATPGPWPVGFIYWSLCHVGKHCEDVYQHMDGTEISDEESGRCPGKEDAELIAAARSALPALLALAKAAEALANAEAQQRVVKTPSGDFGGDFAACGKWIMDRDNDLKVAAIQVRDALAQLKEQE